jgi:hypothetical protein
MKVKAYEWENSVEVELTEIPDVSNGFLVYSKNNRKDEYMPTYVSVKVYYPNDYHYEVCIIDWETDEVKERHCFSSGKECRPEVVARELVKMYQ